MQTLTFPMAVSETSSDAEIIAGLRQGGVEQTRTEAMLYRRHADFVYKRPRKYRLSDEEARDAYTEAFLAVVSHVRSGRFRGESSIKTYLSRIFRNKCVDQHRKNTTGRVNWVEEFPDLADESKNFLQELFGKEEVRYLRQALSKLGERCKELLLLSGTGYSPQEIAEKMGFASPRSASSQRYKCLERLKKLM